MMLFSLTLIWLLLPLSSSEIYLMCEEEYTQEDECRCWRPHSPIIYCAHAGLDAIPHVTKADTVDLTNNNIRSIPSQAFSNVTGLKTILISKNKISTVDNDAFEHLEDMLQWLDLSDNKLSSIPLVFGLEENEGALRNLTHLDLSLNFITSINHAAFRGLTRLRFLFLDRNQVNQVSPDGFLGQTGLFKLKVSLGGMDMNRFPTEHLYNLTSLSLSYGRAQKLRTLRPWLASFSGLRHLQLTRMALRDEHFSGGSFPESLRLQLRSLLLNDNQLRSAPLHALDFPFLTELDLSNNFIEKIRGVGDLHFPLRLEKLNISNNHINNLNTDLLLMLPMATDIDMSNNRIRYLSMSLREIDVSFQPNLILHIGNNPLYCACGYQWMKTLVNRQLENHNGHLTLYEIYNTLRCGYQNSHSGKLIKDVDYCPRRGRTRSK